MSKTYSSKSNARRAANAELSKKHDLSKAQVREREGDLYSINKTDDGYTWEEIIPEPETTKKRSGPTEKDIPHRHKSEVEKPVQAVFNIASEMKQDNPDVTRKEIIAECVNRGIAFYTARTQYYYWKKAWDNDNKAK